MAEDQVSSEQGFNLAELGAKEKFINRMNEVIVPTGVSLGEGKVFRSRGVSLVGMDVIGLKYIFDAMAGKDTRYFGELKWRKKTYEVLRELDEQIDAGIDVLLEEANVFRKRPSMGNFQRFLEVAPRVTIAELPLIVLGEEGG